MPIEAIVFLGGPLLCFLLFTILSWRGRHRISTVVGAVVTVILAAWLLLTAFWVSTTIGTTSDDAPVLVVTPTLPVPSTAEG
ncbi:MAG: hypothetical protein QM753_02840 [Thermomicrobiales bacterium]